MTERVKIFNRVVFNSSQRLAMPIATYPGLALTRLKVRDVVTNSQAQFETQAALQQRYHSPVALSAMDLSVEAEAFGCSVEISDHEIPTVVGKLITTRLEAQTLSVPSVEDGRTAVYLETVRHLRKLSENPLVLGGCIGPFSLAARLTGVTEAMELTLTEPELMRVLLEKCAVFLAAYVRAFRDAGAHGLIMAEPAAGLLSPSGVASFSSAYIGQIARAVADEDFSIILHNCGAKQLHLKSILQTGLKAFHFGAPMDLSAVLNQVPAEVVICGNLDPAAVFCQSEPAEVAARTSELLSATAANPNFVLSSGCDIPPDAPLASLDAFFRAASCAKPIL